MVRKGVNAAITIFGIICLNYARLRLMPGDPALSLNPRDPKYQGLAEYNRELFGFDKPPWEQFVIYLQRTVTLDWGISYRLGLPVFDVLMRDLGWTLVLVGTSTVITIVIGMLVGSIAAQKRGKPFDLVSTATGIFLYGMPIFWLGFLLLAIFEKGSIVGHYFTWWPALPSQGYYDDMLGQWAWDGAHLTSAAQHLILPALTLTLGTLAGISLVMRSSLIDVMTEDFVTTAKAKGLSDRQVLRRHILPNGLPAMVGLAILVLFIGMAVFAPWLAPYGPIERVADTSNCVPNISCPLSPPSAQHPLGISEEGSDIYSQVIWGSQISLIVGIFSAMVASVLGTAVGLVSGYMGGWVDEVMMRFNDVVLSVPWLVLMIIVAARIGTIDLLGLILVIGLTGWSITARVIRAQVLSVKERLFVERARMIGSSRSHILLPPLFPNAFPLIFANTILTVAVSILSEAVLAFLGLSIYNTVSWGKVINQAIGGGALVIGGNVWWLVVPGLCLVFLVFGFYLFGFALDEILNPRLRRR